MKSKIMKAFAAVAMAVAMVFATAMPASALTYTRTINCGTTGYAVVKVTNFLSSSPAQFKVYNASTGAYYGSMSVLSGSQRTWYTALRNAKVVANGNGLTISGWCAY